MQGQATPTTGTRCARHVNREATIICARCGDFACVSCFAHNPAGDVLCLGCLEATELVLASRQSRLMAQLINGGIVLLLVLPFAALSSIDRSLMEYLLGGVGLGVVVLSVIQMVLLTTRGQSLGKMAMGIRIVAKDGSPAGFFSVVFLRVVVPQVISTFCGIFSLVDALSIFSQDSQCIHDHIAGTIVIQADQRPPQSF